MCSHLAGHHRRHLLSLLLLGPGAAAVCSPAGVCDAVEGLHRRQLIAVVGIAEALGLEGSGGCGVVFGESCGQAQTKLDRVGVRKLHPEAF